MRSDRRRVLVLATACSLVTFGAGLTIAQCLDSIPAQPSVVLDKRTEALLMSAPETAKADSLRRSETRPTAVTPSAGSAVAEMVSKAGLAEAFAKSGRVIVTADVLVSAGMSEAVASAVVSGLDRYGERAKRLEGNRQIKIDSDLVFSALPDMVSSLQAGRMSLEARPAQARQRSYWNWSIYIDAAEFNFESQGWAIVLTIRKEAVPDGVWAECLAWHRPTKQLPGSLVIQHNQGGSK